MQQKDSTWQLLPLSTVQYGQLLPNYALNPLQISYTIFAGSAACAALKVANRAYRNLSSPEHLGHSSNPCLVLILRLQSESYSSSALLAPFSLTQKYGNKVFLNRINLGIIKIGYSLLPKLPSAHELHLYFNPQSPFPQLVTDLIGELPFIVSTHCTPYFLNATWLKDRALLRKRGGQALGELRKSVSENDNLKLTNYLRILVKGKQEAGQNEKVEYLIFQPKKTKIVIHKSAHIELNDIVQRIEVPQLYSIVFRSSKSYQQLSHILIKQFRDRSEKRVILLQSGNTSSPGSGLGISTLLHYLSQQNDYIFQRINCKYFANEKQLLRKIESIESFSSSLIYVKNIEWLSELSTDKNDGQQKIKRIVRNLEDAFMKMGDKSFSSHILVIASKGDSVRLDMMKSAVLEKFNLQKQEKMKVLQKIIKWYEMEKRLKVEAEEEEEKSFISMAAQSIGWAELSKIMNKFVLRKKEVVKISEMMEEIGKISSMQKVQNVKNVTWDDIGGLEHAKQEIIQTILLPSKHPEIFDDWIKPRTGLLFFGPPGTGKTLLGKCIANQCKMGFISVKGPELLNMYIGESEKNVREVFERAAASKPCIVFMDELDALIPKRGQSSDSNQVMDRIVSELLMQMDRAAGNGVFIIGATNRPDLLDPSIMRPGRFDKQIYLGISKDKKSRIQILKAQTRNVKLTKDFNFQKIIEKTPQNFTGADFYGLTSRALMLGAQRFIQEYQENGKAEGEVEITEEDFLKALENVKPSVSLDQLRHYERLKEEYK